MRYSLQIADDSSADKWNNYIKSSSHGTIFHTWQWLKIMEKHANSVFYPLKIFKGTSHIANYPLFIKQKGCLKFGLSPTSNTYSLYLGPVLQNYDSYVQKRKEDYLVGIQSEIDRFLFSHLKCNYVRLRTTPGIADSRPLIWAGYRVVPNYTYRLDLNKSLDDIWEHLHKTIRTNIKSAQKKGIVIEEGKKTDILYLESELKRRFIAQGKNRTEFSAFLSDIYDEYNGRNLEISVAKYHGKTVSGVIHLQYNGIVYQWVGVPKSKMAGLSPNELLVWESIISAHEMGQKYYEFMDGGFDPRLRKFKSKFNPDTCIWYSAEKYSHPIYEVARNIYEKIGYSVKM